MFYFSLKFDNEYSILIEYTHRRLGSREYNECMQYLKLNFIGIKQIK